MSVLYFPNNPSAMLDDIEIKIPSKDSILGRHSVIIIGPNGSGKTTYGSHIASFNNAEWIPATRNLALAR